MCEKKIIFIVGCPRSGTTLLRDILISDERIAIPDEELQVVPKVIECLKHNLTDELILSLKRSPYGYFNRSFDFNCLKIKEGELNQKWVNLFSQLTNNNKADFYGEKTPDNFRYIDFLNDHFPSAKFLFVVRDPRDVVISMKRAWGKSYLLALKKWKEAYDFSQNNKENADIHYVFYEDLLKKPNEAMLQIGQWLPCENLEGITLKNFVRSKESYGDSSGKKGIISTNSKKYYQSCPKFAHYAIEHLLSKEMKELGYELDFSKKSTSLLFIFYFYSLFDIPASLVRTFIAQIKHKGLVNGVKYKFSQVLNRYGR